jgi:hypothetical protein
VAQVWAVMDRRAAKALHPVITPSRHRLMIIAGMEI